MSSVSVCGFFNHISKTFFRTKIQINFHSEINCSPWCFFFLISSHYINDPIPRHICWRTFPIQFFVWIFAEILQLFQIHHYGMNASTVDLLNLIVKKKNCTRNVYNPGIIKLYVNTILVLSLLSELHFLVTNEKIIRSA